MKLSNDAIAEFERNGVLILPKLFSEREVDSLNEALEPLMREETPANIREKSSGEVRTAMGLHLRSEIYARVVRHPRLIEPASQILGNVPLYVQQVKVNIKPAFVGEAWQWHYDFATHSHEDGVPDPLALNLHIFLDEVLSSRALVLHTRLAPLWPGAGDARHSFDQLSALGGRCRHRRPVGKAAWNDFGHGPKGHRADLRRSDGPCFAPEPLAVGPPHLLADRQSRFQPADDVPAPRL